MTGDHRDDQPLWDDLSQEQLAEIARAAAAATKVAMQDHQRSALLAAEATWHTTRWLTTVEAPTVRHSLLTAEMDRRKVPDDDRLRDRLTRAVFERLPSLVRDLGMDGPAPSTEAEAMVGRDGMLATEAVALRYLSSVGKNGVEGAKELRVEARRRWVEFGPGVNGSSRGLMHGQLWSYFVGEIEEGTAFAFDVVDEPADEVLVVAPRRMTSTLPVLADLTYAVWKDVIEPASRDNELICPAITRHVRRSLSQAARGRNTREFDDGDGGLALVGSNDTTVGLFPALPRSNLTLLQRGVEAFRGVTLEKTVRTLIRDAFEQAKRGINPYTRIVYIGGFEGFAIAAGINSKDQGQLRALFEALQAYRGPRRDVPSMLTYWLNRGGHRLAGLNDSYIERSELRVDLGEGLMPGYARMAPRGVGRHLLPVLPLPYLDWVGNRVHGALADLQWRILAEMREHVDELMKGRHGVRGVDLAEGTMRRLTRGPSVKFTTAMDALGAWSDDDQPEPWLHRVDRDRYTLRDPEATALLLDSLNVASRKKKLVMKKALKTPGTLRFSTTYT